MAMIQCPECGREISDQASFCPNCGRPVKGASQIVPNALQAPSGEVNGLAIASLVLGIVGLVTMCSKLGLIPSILGLILGCIARNGKKSGQGMATAGIILSSAAIALVLVFWVFLGALGASLVATILSYL